MNAEDKEVFKQYQDPEIMLAHLIQRYGNEQRFIPKKIEELQSLKTPRKEDGKAMQLNLNKI